MSNSINKSNLIIFLLCFSLSRRPLTPGETPAQRGSCKYPYNANQSSNSRALFSIQLTTTDHHFPRSPGYLEIIRISWKGFFLHFLFFFNFFFSLLHLNRSRLGSKVWSEVIRREAREEQRKQWAEFLPVFFDRGDRRSEAGRTIN